MAPSDRLFHANHRLLPRETIHIFQVGPCAGLDQWILELVARWIGIRLAWILRRSRVQRLDQETLRRLVAEIRIRLICRLYDWYRIIWNHHVFRRTMGRSIVQSIVVGQYRIFCWSRRRRIPLVTIVSKHSSFWTINFDELHRLTPSFFFFLEWMVNLSDTEKRIGRNCLFSSDVFHTVVGFSEPIKDNESMITNRFFLLQGGGREDAMFDVQVTRWR